MNGLQKETNSFILRFSIFKIFKKYTGRSKKNLYIINFSESLITRASFFLTVEKSKKKVKIVVLGQKMSKFRVRSKFLT